MPSMKELVQAHATMIKQELDAMVGLVSEHPHHPLEDTGRHESFFRQSEDGHLRRYWEVVADIESRYLRIAINEYDGNLEEVSRECGIPSATLYRYIKKYDIDVSSLRRRGKREPKPARDQP